MRRSLGPTLLFALLALAATLLAPVSAVAPADAAPPSCTTKRWASSWYAAPTDAVLSQPPVAQTFRTQVRPLMGGRKARFRFSNRFGSGPVTFGNATVGKQHLRRGGPAIKPGTLHRIRFDGSRRVTIPAGREVLSDPVRITFRRFRKLLVSVHVVGSPGPATQHGISEQTTWQSAPLTGNRTGNLDGRGFFATPLLDVAPTIPQAIPYLTGVDVRVPSRVGAVATFGDSITDGTESEVLPFVLSADNVDEFVSYPDQLADRIAEAGLPLSVANAAISGNQLLRDASVPIFGEAGLTRFKRDALRRPGVTTVILLEGTNDIGQSGATRDQLVAGYRKAIRKAHRNGVRILLGTLTPMGGTVQPPFYGALGEPTRVAVNEWIRQQRLSDGIVDFDKAVRDPDQPSRILPEYDGGDHLHFSAAGYRAMAEAVPLSELALPRCR